jgi:hypothetical protein
MRRIPNANTLNRVERSLNRRGKKGPQHYKLPPYLHCRFSDPDTPGKSSFRPDGEVTNSLNTDYVQSYDISCTNGHFRLRIVPFLPYQAIIRTGTNGTNDTVVNGMVQTAPSGRIGVSRYLPSTLGLMDAYGLLDDAKVHPVVSPNAAAARITTVSYSLVYTGAPIDAAGTLTTNFIPFKTEIAQGNSNLPIKFERGDTFAVVTRAIGKAQYMLVDYSGGYDMGTIPMSQFTSSYRVDTPIHGVLHATSRERGLRPFREFGVYPIPDTWDFGTATEINMIADPPSSNSLQARDCCINLIDDNFDITEIAYNGPVGTAMGFRLVVKTCVEYDVEPTSTFAAFAVKNDQLKQGELAQEQRVNNQLKPAIPADKPLIVKPEPTQSTLNQIAKGLQDTKISSVLNALKKKTNQASTVTTIQTVPAGRPQTGAGKGRGARTNSRKGRQ